MNAVADLRRLSAAELAAVGDQSLGEHLLAQALVTRHRHGPLTPEKIETFLGDRDCLRYSTRLVFEFGEMALHQFAQPAPDPRDPEGKGRVLYLRPGLREQPDRVVQAVAYMIPVINYGDIVSDHHCLVYGATVLGLREEEYYRQLCDLADAVGAVTKDLLGRETSMNGGGG